MDILSGLESGKYRLGTLCKRGHDWDGTRQSVRYANGAPGCVFCGAMHAKRYNHERNAKARQERLSRRIDARNGKGILISIYGLFDPPGNCFYVGRTSQSLNVRLKDHILDSKTSSCKRAQAIRKIIESGNRPSIKVLAKQKCFNRQDVEQLEQSWIDWMSVQYPLTNEASADKGAVIGEYGRKIPESVIAMMGKVPDSEIALMIGCTSSNAGVIRRNLGIAAFNSYFQWDDDSINLLGTKSDPDIAKMFNTTRSVVQKKREELGIPPCPQHPYVWSDEILAMLGTVPDRVIAEKLGMNHWSAVQRKRKSLGIPSFREAKKCSK